MKLSALAVALTTVVTGSLAWTAPAHAEPCMNDIDCKTNGTLCGTDICDWNVMPQVCAPAGHKPKGQDGWCATDTDCKCHGEGATCAGTYCTFTTPPADAGGGSGSAASSGSTSSGTSGTSGSSGTSAPAGGAAKSSSCSMALGGAETTTHYGVAALALTACFAAARRRRPRR